ncbi:transposase [Methylococcus sp. ANG]|uniref:transposase n=1 Tax=Methylococcus sp. ANG TaxID=3231903 RepID=UPI003C12B6A4
MWRPGPTGARLARSGEAALIQPTCPQLESGLDRRRSSSRGNGEPDAKPTRIASDERFAGRRLSLGERPQRCIGYHDPETGKHYVFLTNNTRLAGGIIAAIYKDRWQIELFFKWIKQKQPIPRLLQLNLFERRDLMALLSDDPPEPTASPLQTRLLFA